MSEDRRWRVPTRGEVVRDQLVRAGMDVLLERGWPGLTVRAVAARAGVTPSLVCYHFGGVALFRRVVVAEVVLGMLTPALDAMAAAPTWQKGVATVLHEVADEPVLAADGLDDDYDDVVVADEPGPAQRHLLADLVLASMQDAVVREVLQDSLALARERLTGWLERLRVPEEHLDGAAVLLVALLDGLLLHRQVDPGLPVRDAAAALAGLAQPPCRAGTTSRSNSSMPLVS